ncbi:hypothetical protein TNIN_335571 [Trichonephila inaurata madagascariensis]|uniref:Uncharacterized protein n=1 Tax=Trichonephila inaurata madagascariensis TaxID=2747483 RepID=A0A8X6WQG8_9ARAC|nr:hypothetical protein TNIN_335571 [Trichonephila inaurata madagascariensis]
MSVLHRMALNLFLRGETSDNRNVGLDGSNLSRPTAETHRGHRKIDLETVQTEMSGTSLCRINYAPSDTQRSLIHFKQCVLFKMEAF